MTVIRTPWQAARRSACERLVMRLVATPRGRLILRAYLICYRALRPIQIAIIKRSIRT